MLPDRVQAILSWEPPRNVKEIQKFVGFTNYYRQFIKNLAQLTQPITDLTKRGTPFIWTTTQQAAFDTLKRAFTTAPLLRHPDTTLPFVLQTDASNGAVGAVLLQPSTPGGTDLLPCAFYSRRLTPAEKGYDILNRELLAIYQAFAHWRHLLEGAQFPVEVRTDHKNLQYLHSSHRLNQRQMRWAQFFSRFDFHITHIPGSQNTLADALSRPPGTNYDPPSTVSSMLSPRNLPQPIQQASETNIRATNARTHKDLAHRLREQQQRDQWAREKMQQLKDHSTPSDSPFAIEDNLLTYAGRLYIPQPCREEILQQCHDHPSAGHGGLYKTTELTFRHYWWPRFRHDIRKYVHSCATCRRSKPSTTAPAGLLHPLPTPDAPWKIVSMDFITDLPMSNGFTTILVVVDLFSKAAHFIPCRGLPTAEQTAQLFLDNVYRHRGLVQEIISDRGTQFTSRFWKALFDILHVKISLASTSHPQSDGQSERVNQVLETYLRSYVNFQQNNWCALLPMAEFAYNNSVHASTKMSPFEVLYGSPPRRLPLNPPNSDMPRADSFVQDLQAAHQLLYQQLELAKATYKRSADSRRQEGETLGVGDQVWVSTKFLKSNRPSRKLDDRFIGPFKVEKVINPVAFRLALPRSMRIHPVFHRSLLTKNPPPSPLRSHVEPPPPVIIEGQPEFEVQEILDSRRVRGKLQYLIHWKGYGVADRTWEPASNVHAPILTQRFHSKYPNKPAPKNVPKNPIPSKNPPPTSTNVSEQEEQASLSFSISSPPAPPLSSPPSSSPSRGRPLATSPSSSSSSAYTTPISSPLSSPSTAPSSPLSPPPRFKPPSPPPMDVDPPQTAPSTPPPPMELDRTPPRQLRQSSTRRGNFRRGGDVRAKSADSRGNHAGASESDSPKAKADSFKRAQSWSRSDPKRRKTFPP